jgi:hypothetical protein
MQTIQQITITDSNGRTATVELTITHNFLQFMSDPRRRSERPALARKEAAFR